MKGTFGILKFLKAPVKNERSHSHPVTNWASTPGSLLMYKPLLGHCQYYFTGEEGEGEEGDGWSYYEPSQVHPSDHALCLRGQSKLCFKFLQKPRSKWEPRSRGSGVRLTIQ